MEKLGIVIPYRDRREHLEIFLSYMREFLRIKGLSNYEFFVVEQDDSELFNRGLLLNCGFTEAEKQDCAKVCFHDVDLLPVESDLYSLYPEEPTELVRKIEGSSETLPYNYFGGVTLVSAEDFRKVNGYSNKYEGWGFEDDDFLLRCHKAHVGRTVRRYKISQTSGPAGIFRENRTVSLDIELLKGMVVLVADFLPEYPTNSVGLQDMVAVSLMDPLTGLKTSISYDKFNCYRGTVWDKNWNQFSVVSGKAPLLHSRCVLAIDRARKQYSFYWNGQCLGKYELRSSELQTLREKKGKIIVGERFRGAILEAGCFVTQMDLTDEELEQVSTYYLDPEANYDARVSVFYRTTREKQEENTWISTKVANIPVPLQAEVGTYKTLSHKGANIVIDGHYLPEICRNQERFYRVSRGEVLEEEDGLSTLSQWKRTVEKVEPDVTWVKVRKK